MLSNLRLVVSVDVQPGDQHNVKHATGGLWSLLDRWDRGRWPRLLRGDLAWGIEPVMAQAEQRNLAYLFRLRTTKNVSRALQRAMAQSDWSDAGQGWQGNETRLRLEGWSRHRRGSLVPRSLERPLGIFGHRAPVPPHAPAPSAGSRGGSIRNAGPLCVCPPPWPVCGKGRTRWPRSVAGTAPPVKPCDITCTAASSSRPFDSTPPKPQSPVVPSHLPQWTPQPTAGFRFSGRRRRSRGGHVECGDGEISLCAGLQVS